VADEHAARIAEQYQREPLLRGMSIPRLRLPEVVIDLPVVVEGYDPGIPERAAKPERATQAVEGVLREHAEELALSDEQRAAMLREVGADIERAQAELEREPPVSKREALSRVALGAMRRVAAEQGDPRLSEHVTRLAPTLRDRVAAVAVEAPGRPPTLRVAVATDEVKTRASNLNVTRVRIRLREEGLEWSDVVTAEGEKTSRLTPE
jgi:hypothetical protein